MINVGNDKPGESGFSTNKHTRLGESGYLTNLKTTFSIMDSAGRTASISYSGASIGTLSYSWDDNKNKGNITLMPSVLRSNSSSLLLNWDMDNRLSTADVGNNSSVDVTYKFDALGRRVDALMMLDLAALTTRVSELQQRLRDRQA